MRHVRLYIAIVLLALGALSCVQGFVNAVRSAGSQDFQWSPSRYLLNHENPYRLYLQHQSGELETNPFPLSQVPNYPASALVFLWPLAALDLDISKWLWAAANLLFGIGCVALIGRMAGTSVAVLLGLLGLFFMSTPVRNTIGNGQQGLFSLLFFLLAVHLQTQKRSSLAALCLAACWLKYTITFPLSLVFIRREWRTTLAIASAIHVALILFLAIWTGENPLKLVLGPLMVSETGVDSSMFDVIAIASYLGVSSRIAAVSVGFVILIATAFLIIRSKSDLVTNLTLLSLVSLIWSHHAPYDYFVLIIPLTLAAQHWQQGSIGILDIQIALSVLFVWFVQRILDAAGTLFQNYSSLAFESQVVFWLACMGIYAAFVTCFASVYLQGRETAHDLKG